MPTSKNNYECETRKNDRGGWEIGLIGDPAGSGIGNYPTESEAFKFASYNYNLKAIKRGEDTKVTPAPVRQPSTSGRIVRRVKALTK